MDTVVQAAIDGLAFGVFVVAIIIPIMVAALVTALVAIRIIEM